MSVSLEDARGLAGRLLAKSNFFATLPLAWRHDPAADRPWEVFRGRLLEPAHTRRRWVLESWDVFLDTPEGPAAEPLVGLKLDAGAGELHVVRGVDSYVWEGYDAGGGMVESREARRWVLELIGTVRLANFPRVEEVRAELGYLLLRAVVGARLPLTPEEAPLPGFTFGELFYLDRGEAGGEVLARGEELLPAFLDVGRARGVAHRVLEAWLRALPGGGEVGFPAGLD